MFLPVSNKLKELAGEELTFRQMQLEAILSIQAGDNPRVLAEKLEAFLPPAERVDRAAAAEPAEEHPEIREAA